MDGWLNWLDEWIAGEVIACCIDGWLGGWIVVCLDGWLDNCSSVLTGWLACWMDAVSGWIAGQLDGRMDVWTNRWADYCLSGSMADWPAGRLVGWKWVGMYTEWIY